MSKRDTRYKATKRAFRRKCGKLKKGDRRYWHKHSLEYLQRLLHEFDMTWGHFFESDRRIVLRDAVFVARCGKYMGHEVVAIISGGQFVAVHRLSSFERFKGLLPHIYNRDPPLSPFPSSGVAFTDKGLYGITMAHYKNLSLFSERIINWRHEDDAEPDHSPSAEADAGGAALAFCDDPHIDRMWRKLHRKRSPAIWRFAAGAERPA